MIKNFGEMGAAFSFCIVSAITAFVFILSFKKIMEIPREIIEWSVLLFIFMSVTIFLFIKTSSDLLLLILIVLGALAAYKVGDFKINDLIKTNA
jgi:hypothetical protein